MAAQSSLVRKQYLVTEENVKKIEALASIRGTSGAEIVRQAIDAYDPVASGELDAPELLELVSEKLKEAILATRKTRRKVSKVLRSLQQEEGE